LTINGRLFVEHFFVEFIMPPFEIVPDFKMAGDQPQVVWQSSIILPPLLKSEEASDEGM